MADIFTWVQHNMNEDWRGIAAMVMQPPVQHHYIAYLHMIVGHEVTILGPLVSLWHNTYFIAGDYVFPATTHLNHDHALLG